MKFSQTHLVGKPLPVRPSIPAPLAVSLYFRVVFLYMYCTSQIGALHWWRWDPGKCESHFGFAASFLDFSVQRELYVCEYSPRSGMATTEKQCEVSIW